MYDPCAHCALTYVSERGSAARRRNRRGPARGVWWTRAERASNRLDSRLCRLLHHFRYKNRHPWLTLAHFPTAIAISLVVAGRARIFERDSNDKPAHDSHSTFARSISFRPCRFFRRIRCAIPLFLFSPATSLRNANWKAEGTVHVRDYLPRSAGHCGCFCNPLATKILCTLAFVNSSRLRFFFFFSFSRREISVWSSRAVTTIRRSI